MAPINVAALQRAAEKYDPLLRKLPFLDLNEVLANLEINLKEVTYKDTIIQFQRKSGSSKPYVAGIIDYTTEIGKMVERSLIVLPCYNAIKDHIKNYSDKAVLNPAGDKVDNQTKKHPLEQLILETQVRTIGEDIVDGLFHGERDTNDKSPLGMVDGIYTMIAAEIAATTISVANGNYATSGALSAPVNSDTVALDRLVTWLRSANRMLLKDAVLYIAPDALDNVQDALENKMINKPADVFTALEKYLQNKVRAPKLRLLSHEAMGAGSQLILAKPRNIDLGMNTKGDNEFLQVRAPFEDPNYVQFWSQWELGARLNSLHAKEFFCNEQTNTPSELSGDYTS